MRPPESPAWMFEPWLVVHRWQFTRWLPAHRTAQHFMDATERASRGYAIAPRFHVGDGSYIWPQPGDRMQLWGPKTIDAEWVAVLAPELAWWWA